MDLALEGPLNSLSFGQTFFNILKELFARGVETSIFPIGNSGDLSAYEASDEFKKKLEEAIARGGGFHDRKVPSFKLWHLNGALSSYSDKRLLMTFHETDTLTQFEINAIRNQDIVFVTSQYTKEVFNSMGLYNVVYCPLGIDKTSFFETFNRRMDPEIIVFGLGGKLEKRKHHFEVLRAWIKKYGNNPRYRLNCAVANTHLPENIFTGLIGQAFEGKRYHNVNFLPYMQSNAAYNSYLNENDIYIAMSGGEGFDLPCFQSACIGKYIVALNAHVYKDYLTNDNACLVEPSGKEPVYDGIFFHPNQPFNQGQIFKWEEEAFLDACNRAEDRIWKNRINEPGRELGKIYSYEKTVETILSQV